MRLRFLGILVFVFVAADDPKDAVKKELKQIEGTWKVTSFELNGNSIGTSGWTIVLKGDKYTLTFGDNTEEGTFKIDPAKKPKTVEATSSAGSARKGIYVLEGNKAKACFATAGQDAPKAFETSADSGHYLWE